MATPLGGSGKEPDGPPGGSWGLTGAASGLAGGGLAGKFFGGGEGSSDEGRLAHMEERLQLLEDQVRELQEIVGSPEASAEPEDETDPKAS